LLDAVFVNLEFLRFEVVHELTTFILDEDVGRNTFDLNAIRRPLHGWLRDGGRLTVLGLALGLVGALAIGFAMRSQLFGVGVFDPLTLGTVLVLIAGTALFACWLPARRAARVSPIEALRYE
jgi:hypothetical protein